MGCVLRRFGLVANPVFVREFRTRVRGAKSFIVQGVFCVVLMGALGLLWLEAASASAYRAQSAAEFSRDAFYIMMCVQAVLVPLIAPAMSAGVISLERERETLDLLLLTPLSREAILLGKLGASLGQLGVVVLAGVPVLSGVCLMLGGVSPQEMVLAYAFVLLSGACFGAIGILCSCVFRRTAVAAAVAYMAAVFCMAGSVMLDVVIDIATRSYGNPVGLLILSPPATIAQFMDPGLDTAITDLVGYALGIDVAVWMLSVPIFLFMFLLSAIISVRRLKMLRTA